MPRPRTVDARKEFTDRMRKAVGWEIWGKLRVANYCHNTNEIHIGPVDHLCFDDITIAVTPTQGGYRVRLLDVNGQHAGTDVEWRAFITYVRHLFVAWCDARFMGETDMMETLQSVLDWYRVEGVALKYYHDDIDEKTVVLRGARRGPLFVEINGGCRVRECRDFERPRWRTMCENIAEARAKGCMAVDDERGSEPDGLHAQLRKFDSKLLRHCLEIPM